MPRPPVNAPLRDLVPWVPPSPARVAAAVIATALAAAAIALFAGWWAGGAAGVDEPAAAPRAPLVATLAGVRVLAPSRWTLDDAPEAARLAPGRTAVFSVDPTGAARAILTVAPADHPSLLPAGLRAMLARAPGAARATFLAGSPAWRYKGLATRTGQTLEVTVLPTTAGVLALACSHAASEPASACDAQAPAIDLGRAAAVAPAADLALRRRLPAVVARLDGRRVPLRRALAAAETRRGQSRFAERLARAYRRTGTRLAPVAPARSGVVRATRRGDVAYRRLARAARRGERAGFARARRGVGTAERALGRALR